MDKTPSSAEAEQPPESLPAAGSPPFIIVLWTLQRVLDSLISFAEEAQQNHLLVKLLTTKEVLSGSFPKQFPRRR